MLNSQESIFENYTYEVLTQNYLDYDLSFKIIIIGDSGVGKTKLLSKAINKTFDIDYCTTVGFEFSTYSIKINDKICKLHIWDTCGQEVYKSLILNFYRNCSLAILIYSIDNELSFEHVENWNNDIMNNCNIDTKKFLVGNKIDLENDREITKEEAESFAQKENIKYIETSAIKNMKVNEAFTSLLNDIYRNKQEEEKGKLYLQNVVPIELSKNKNNNNELFCC
jgi:small GTP-binding protein